MLYSLQGYWYCDLLLAKRDWDTADQRAARAIELAKREGWLLDIALDTLVRGRAHLGLALESASFKPADHTRNARYRLNEAVDGLQASGQNFHIPRGLIARAAFQCSLGDWVGAARDLDEVEEVAELGPMKLYLCDMAIERARLAFAQIEAFAPLNGLLETDNPPSPSPHRADEVAQLKSEAAKQLKTAADYIATCGYHRRDEELAELRTVLVGSPPFRRPATKGVRRDHQMTAWGQTRR